MQTTGRQTRIAALASTALVVGLAACGSSNSTGPKSTGPTAAQSAHFFDSVYSSYLAGGSSEDSTAARLVADYLEFPPAYGATQSTFTVTTAGGSQTWYGFTYGIVPDGGDSVYATIAYDGTDLEHVLIFEQSYPSGTGEYEAALLDFSTFSEYDDSTASGSASETSVGSACSELTGLAADTVMADFLGDGTCQAASYTVSASVQWSAASDLGALETLSFSGVKFNGARFAAGSGQGVVRGPSKLAALIERLRAGGHLLPHGFRSAR